jgi:hypothetical protein
MVLSENKKIFQVQPGLKISWSSGPKFQRKYTYTTFVWVQMPLQSQGLRGSMIKVSDS